MFTALCSSSDVAFTLPLSFFVSLHVYMLGRHSFASLIDKQLSRNATLMSLDVLLSEFSSYFHLNQLSNCLGPEESVLPGHSAARPPRLMQKTEIRHLTRHTEQARSISSLLYDQKSCECSVKTRQSFCHVFFRT